MEDSLGITFIEIRDLDEKKYYWESKFPVILKIIITQNYLVSIH